MKALTVMTSWLRLRKSVIVIVAMTLGTSVMSGCASHFFPQDSLPQELSRYPVTMWQTRAQDQLTDSVLETVTTGTAQLADSGDVTLLPTVTRRYTPEGVLVMLSEQGPAVNQVEKVLVKGTIPVRRAFWRDGVETLQQHFRYSSTGDLIAVEPPAVEDASGAWIGPGNLSYATGTAFDGRQADFFYSGDYRMLPGSQRRPSSPCWQVGYVSNMQLLKACDNSRFQVLVVGNKGQLLQRRELVSVPEMIDLQKLLHRPVVWSEEWDWSNDLQPVSFQQHKDGKTVSKTWRYQNGHLITEIENVRSEDGAVSIRERRYSDTVVDAQGNWIARKVAVFLRREGQPNTLQQNESWQREMTYKLEL